MPRKVLCALAYLLLGLLMAPLHAQARLAVYGTVGGENSGIYNRWVTAGTFGLYVGVANFGPIALALDGRADLSSDIKSGFVGPRLAVHPPIFPIKPYVELLIGESTFAPTPARLQPANGFAGRYVLGADTTILPHVDWRVIDFSGGISHSVRGDAKTVSTGLVLRF